MLQRQEKPALMELAPLHEVLVTGGECKIEGELVRFVLYAEREAYVGVMDAPRERIAIFRGVMPLTEFVRLNRANADQIAPRYKPVLRS